MTRKQLKSFERRVVEGREAPTRPELRELCALALAGLAALARLEREDKEARPLPPGVTPIIAPLLRPNKLRSR